MFQSLNTTQEGHRCVHDYADECIERTKRIGANVADDEFSVERLTRTVTRCVERLNSGDEKLLLSRVIAHGDYVTDNVLMDNRGVLYIVDPKNLGYAFVEKDLTRFRIWLVHLSRRGLFRQPFLGYLWREFWDYYTASGASAEVSAFAYLHDVLGRVARLTVARPPSALAIAPRRILVRRDQCVWFKTWFEWLKQVDGDLGELCAHMRNTL